MNIDNVRTWTTAMRSGAFKQGVGKLKQSTGVGDFLYCCMGVGCEVAGIPDQLGMFHNEEAYTFEDEELLPPLTFWDWLGIPNQDGGVLSIDWVRGYPNVDVEGRELNWNLDSLNDSDRFTFDQIADLIDYFSLTS